MEEIQSINNPKVKLWNKLLTKKGREKNNLYLAEGIKLIEEAIKTNQEIDSIIYVKEKGLPEQILDLINENGSNIDLFATSNVIFNKLAETETPQGVIAVIKQNEWKSEQILASNKSFFLLIDQIQDPGNLGSIIRSADAAGVEAVILGKGTVDLYNSKVIRSTMGSIFHLPILSVELTDFIKELQTRGVNIIGTSPYAKEMYYDVDLQGKVAILVGNEANGLQDHRLTQVDKMAKIPIIGQAESLNVAMATTIMLFERVRQININ